VTENNSIQNNTLQNKGFSEKNPCFEVDFTAILCYYNKWSSSIEASLFFHCTMRKKWQAATATYETVLSTI